MENEALDIRQRNPTALVEWAEKTVKDLESWWHKEWWSHLWMVGVSNGLAVLVPFGLAILLYIPDTLKMKLNVALNAVVRADRFALRPNARRMLD